MRIDHDKVSGALYIKLRDGEYDHTEDFSEGADVYLDVDAEGNVLGLEALSFEDLAQAIEERGGKLDVPERLGAAEVRAFAALTPRERQVLQLLAEGKSSREIAESLSISFGTLRQHVERAMESESYEEALRDDLVATELYLATLAEEGRPIPEPDISGKSRIRAVESALSELLQPTV